MNEQQETLPIEAPAAEQKAGTADDARDICVAAMDQAIAIGWDWSLEVNRARTEYTVKLFAPESGGEK